MNFAVVGLGKIGIMHSAMLRRIPGTQLAALIDRVPKLGRHFQSMMENPPPVFADLASALKQVQLNGVWVCTA